MTRWHVRCRSCRARRVLPKHPDLYRLQPQCRRCRVRNYVADLWMNQRNTRAMACYCYGYPFIHRVSSRFCQFRKDRTERLMGDPDFNARGYEEYLEECNT